MRSGKPDGEIRAARVPGVQGATARDDGGFRWKGHLDELSCRRTLTKLTAAPAITRFVTKTGLRGQFQSVDSVAVAMDEEGEAETAEGGSSMHQKQQQHHQNHPTKKIKSK